MTMAHNSCQKQPNDPIVKVQIWKKIKNRRSKKEEKNRKEREKRSDLNRDNIVDDFSVDR